MKRTVFKVLFSLLLIILACFFLLSCSKKSPALEDVKEDFTSLIEASGEINTIFFGEGLPTYERGGEYAEENMIYEGISSAYDKYEIVSTESKYITVNEIKAAAEKVYSKDYLEPIYETTFVGYADETTGIFSAKYYEADGLLFKNTSFNSFIKSYVIREYDFSTMEIINPSTEDFVNISIESSVDGKKEAVNLSFTKQDGEWRLDSPTY